MTYQIDRALEKRARDMFEDQRRGANRFTTWGTIGPERQAEWREKARLIEEAISAGINRQTNSEGDR